MKTLILHINSKKPERNKIRKIANILKQGGIVTFPTETIYGLGANTFDDKAIKRIFKAKMRPNDNPLIVHIADKKEISMLVTKVPKRAEKLINAFWPGPLTIILKKSELVPDSVTAGLDSVAVRMPNNKIALAMIKECGFPIAAPSANLSGKPSPTEAKHVIEDMNGRVNAIISSDKSKIGLESTVLDLTCSVPSILRPGGITKEQLSKVIGRISINSCIRNVKIKRTKVRSPGMKYKHYAPNAPLILIKGKERSMTKKINQLIQKYKGKKVGIIKIGKTKYHAETIITIGKNYNEIAKNLFRAFRAFNYIKVDVILSESVSEKGIGLAIMNRLNRAATEIIKV